MRYALPLLLFPLVLAACDGGVADEPDVRASTFEATLEGARAAQLEGAAWFLDASPFGPLPFDFGEDLGLDSLLGTFAAASVMLDAVTEGGAMHHILLSFPGDGPPAPGTYELGQATLDVPEGDSLGGPLVLFGLSFAGSPLATYAVAEGGRYTTYVLASGAVEITAASAGHVEGTFTMTAETAYAYAGEGELEAPTEWPFPNRPRRPLMEPDIERLDPPLQVVGAFHASTQAPPARR